MRRTVIALCLAASALPAFAVEEAKLLEEAMEVRKLHDHADRTNHRGRCRNDLVGGQAHHVATGSGDSVDGDGELNTVELFSCYLSSNWKPTLSVT